MIIYNLNISGVTNIARTLVNASNTDVDMPNARGQTPMMMAAKTNNLSLVELLGQQNAIDIDTQDNEGCTSLHYASQHASLKVVSILLAKGADMTIKNNSGESSLILAAREGNRDIFMGLMLKMAHERNIKEAISEFSKLSIGENLMDTLAAKEMIENASMDQLMTFVLTYQNKYSF